MLLALLLIRRTSARKPSGHFQRVFVYGVFRLCFLWKLHTLKEPVLEMGASARFQCLEKLVEKPKVWKLSEVEKIEALLGPTLNQ